MVRLTEVLLPGEVGGTPGVLGRGAVSSSGILTRPCRNSAGWHPGNERGGAGADELLLPQLLECVHRVG